MRYFAIALIMLLYAAGPAHAQISVGIRTHDVSIGFNVSSYPRMVAIPGYPVYYDPQVDSNYFFYDGLYWVFQGDNWYSSSWYDGPWDLIGPEDVPLFVLRIPVRYYRHRPSYFSGWSLNIAPRWGEHWGRDWEQRRSGWDNWDHHSVPRAAPLPSYQSRYSGSRYPRATDQQYSIESRNYRYQPREAVTQQYLQRRAAPNGSRQMTPPPAQTPRPTGTQNRTQTQTQVQQQRQQQTQDKVQAQQHNRAQEVQAQQRQRADVQRQTQQKQTQQRQQQAQDKVQMQHQNRAQEVQAQQRQRADVQRQTQPRQQQAQDKVQVQQQRTQNAQSQQQKRVQSPARPQQQPVKPVQKGQGPERKAKASSQDKQKDNKTDGGPGNTR